MYQQTKINPLSKISHDNLTRLYEIIVCLSLNGYKIGGIPSKSVQMGQDHIKF